MTAVEELLKEIGSDGLDMLMLVREMSGLVSYYRNLLERFELDTLTGLPGSNKYHECKADLEKHNVSSIGVIVFDVNDLKYYNDNKGHQAGDLLLQKAAESFQHIYAKNECGRTCRRAADLERFRSICKNVRVFRTGGDEFVALITNCVESDIDDIVATWKEKLAALNAADDGVRCTIAHGAAFGSGGFRLEDIIQLADERMYAEKRKMKESGIKLGEIR